jgi:hypothetical protein
MLPGEGLSAFTPSSRRADVMTNLDETHISAPAAGLQLGVSTTRVYTLAQTGQLDALLGQDGRWRISRESVRRVLAQRATPSLASASA